MRRVLSALTLTGLLALGPTVAWAGTYPAPEIGVEVDLPGSVAEPGTPFAVWIPAPDGTEVTLTISDGLDDSAQSVQIAGTITMTRYAQGGGARFDVTLLNPGNYTITGQVDGVVVLAMAVTAQVDGADQAGDGPAGADTAAAAPGGGPRAGIATLTGGVAERGVTGSEAMLYGVGAVLLIGAGAVLVAQSRRRRQSTK